MTDINDLRDRLEDVQSLVDAGPGPVVVVGEAEGYPSAEEFERQHGHPPAEADAVVIHLPAEVAGY